MAVVATGLAQSFTVSGRVTDATTGEYILGANVVNVKEGKGMATNAYGFFSMTLPAGSATLSCSFIGYETATKTFAGNQDEDWNVALAPQAIAVDAAEVVGTAGQNTQSTDLGKAEVAIATIQRLPALMGEVDVLKAIQLLPGIQSAGEGNSGFYVRGGGPDQNLLLLDNAAIYNASHLFGFFSVFNADAISNVEVYKGSMPARFGGRVSSVLDLGLREGNRNEFKGSGGIGLISSRLTLEGPIKRGVSSFIVSARRTYIDVLTKPFIQNTQAAGSGYYFYDLNAKFNHRFSEKDEVFLSGYFGRDVFSFASADAGFNASIPWGNAMVSGRWNHLLTDKLFLNVNGTYSNYEFSFQSGQDEFEFGFDSGVKDLSGKAQLSWYPNLRHEIRGGVDYVFHEFVPTSFFFRQGDEEFDFGDAAVAFSHESSLYLEDQFDVSDALRINAGIRGSDFRHVGPFTRIVPGESLLAPGDTIRYGRGELVKRYGGWEPRLSAQTQRGQPQQRQGRLLHQLPIRAPGIAVIQHDTHRHLVAQFRFGPTPTRKAVERRVLLRPRQATGVGMLRGGVPQRPRQPRGIRGEHAARGKHRHQPRQQFGVWRRHLLRRGVVCEAEVWRAKRLGGLHLEQNGSGVRRAERRQSLPRQI